MKALARQASFGAGEFSSRAVGRTDLPQYNAGLKTLSNWIVSPQGSATRRPGFKYAVTAKTFAPVVFTERANPKNFLMQGVVWAEELALWVAVGQADGTDAYIVTSPDGITWTERANPKNFTLNQVVWSGSLFVAVGNADGTDAYIVTSPDGITWTERANAKNFTLFGIAWSGSLFVVVGQADGTDAYIVTSPDGITWTERANAKNFTLYKVAWFGSLFVVVGQADGTDAYIVTSPDGITWTERANPKNFTLRSIAWSGSLFVVVGLEDGTDAYIVTSPDGITWTERANPKNFTLRSIAWSGSLFVAVGYPDGTDAYIVTSPDGITWTEQANPKNFELYGVAWSGSLFVAVGAADGTDAYMLSSVGQTSNRRLEPFIGSSGTPYLMELSQEIIRFIRNESYIESSPGVPYEVTAPWDAQDIATLQFAQANDVMYITHPKYRPRRLTRTTEVSFTLVDLMDPTTPALDTTASTFKLWDGPYLDENNTVTTVTLSATGTGSKTATSSSAIFASTDVGRLLRVKGEFVWGWGIITAVATSTSATVYIVEDPNTTAAQTRWMLGAWSATTGYPTAIAFFQQRLVFANTGHEPMRVWASVIGSFQEFGPSQLDDTIVADNGVYFTIASQRMLPVKWLKASHDLYAGTKGGVFRIDAGEGANEISPGALRIRQAAGYGAESATPELIGDNLLYVQQSKRIVRALGPQTTDVLTLPDLTLLSEHFGASGIEQMEFASVPSSIVWMRRTDGLLIGLTLNPVTQIMAWHRHPMAGSLTGFTYPTVLSIAVLPISGRDQVWAVVRRTINGSDIETVEVMEALYDSLETSVLEACFLDSAVWYNGVATTSITGLGHLEAQSVYAYADGITQGPFTVASGAITLTTAASKAWVGLNYSALSDLEILPVKSSDSNNAKVRIITTMVEVLDTNALLVGASAATLVALNPRLEPDTWTAGTIKPLVTGDREHKIPGNSQTRPTVLIRPDGPLPATVTGLTHMVDFHHV